MQGQVVLLCYKHYLCIFSGIGIFCRQWVGPSPTLPRNQSTNKLGTVRLESSEGLPTGLQEPQNKIHRFPLQNQMVIFVGEDSSRLCAKPICVYKKYNMIYVVIYVYNKRLL